MEPIRKEQRNVKKDRDYLIWLQFNIKVCRARIDGLGVGTTTIDSGIQIAEFLVRVMEWGCGGAEGALGGKQGLLALGRVKEVRVAELKSEKE